MPPDPLETGMLHMPRSYYFQFTNKVHFFVKRTTPPKILAMGLNIVTLNAHSHGFSVC